MARMGAQTSLLNTKGLHLLWRDGGRGLGLRGGLLVVLLWGLLGDLLLCLRQAARVAMRQPLLSLILVLQTRQSVSVHSSVDQDSDWDILYSMVSPVRAGHSSRSRPKSPMS